MSLGQKALQLGYSGVTTCSTPANCVYWGKSDCSLARDVVNQLCHEGLHWWGVGPWIQLSCLRLPVPASWEGTVLLDIRLLSGMFHLEGEALFFQILESQVYMRNCSKISWVHPVVASWKGKSASTILTEHSGCGSKIFFHCPQAVLSLLLPLRNYLLGLLFGNFPQLSNRP